LALTFNYNNSNAQYIEPKTIRFRLHFCLELVK
jgi:hypothetical protein